MTGPVRLDPTPARISTNLSIERQTPKRDFGDRMKAGLDVVGGTLANGASVIGAVMPGGAILSAAVSSVSQLGGAAGRQGGASGQYAASGIVNIGGGGNAINTTVGTGGGATTNLPGLGTTVGGAPSTLGSSTGGSNQIAGMNSDLVQSQADNASLLKVQIALQHENQVFSSVSNVLKTRHDTVKNSIGNIR